MFLDENKGRSQDLVKKLSIKQLRKKESPKDTAIHQDLSKYLTAQDNQISPTSTKPSKALSSHGNLLSLQSQSTMQEWKTFFLFLVLSKQIPKLIIALSWNN